MRAPSRLPGRSAASARQPARASCAPPPGLQLAARRAPARRWRTIALDLRARGVVGEGERARVDARLEVLAAFEHDLVELRCAIH